MIDWDQLRIFYYVALYESCTRAAEVLNISQPSVSRTINLLEDRLGIKLFRRLSHGLGLNRYGKMFFQIIEPFFTQLEDAKSLIREENIEPHGKLKISTTPALGSSWLMQYLPNFLKLHPKMRVQIIGALEKIDVARADVAIRTFIPHQPNLAQRLLQTFHMRLWAHPNYLKEYGIPQTPEDLDNHRLISFGIEPHGAQGNIDWLLTVGRMTTQARIPYLQVNSAEGLLNAAKAGVGIVELSEQYPNLRDSGLVSVLPDLEGPKVEIFYIYPEPLKRSKCITALADYLEETLAQEKAFELTQESANDMMLQSTLELAS